MQRQPPPKLASWLHHCSQPVNILSSFSQTYLLDLSHLSNVPLRRSPGGPISIDPAVEATDVAIMAQPHDGGNMCSDQMTRP
jgi:hypothetical protein